MYVHTFSRTADVQSSCIGSGEPTQLPTWPSNFVRRKGGWPMHAQGMGYAVRSMHVLSCMHFCRRAEAQVFLMQECHASVAYNLHVYLYIWP